MRHVFALAIRAGGAGRRGFLRHAGLMQSGRRALLTLLFAGCGASSARDADAPAPAAPELHRGELTDFVPAAGLRWLIVGSPAGLASEPALAPLRERWLTRERLQAFARVSGVDLLRTRRGLVAGFDLGTLYMADGSGWTDAAPERRFAERLAGTEMPSQSHPRVWRVTGLVGSQPEALVRVADELLAVAVGDPQLARIVELFAEQRLRRAAPVFQGAALSTLPEELLRPRTFAFYLPGPFEEDWLPARGGLLAAAQALVVTLDLRATELELRLVLSGSWDVAADSPRLAEAWHGLATSSLGVRLGLDRPRAPAEPSGSQGLLSYYTRLDAALFAAGVEALLAGNLDDLLGIEEAPAAAIARACHSPGYACPTGGRQDRPDGQFAFDVGGRTVRGSDRSSAGGGEPRGGPRVQPGRVDQRRAQLGRTE